MEARAEQGMRVMGMISGTSVDAIDVAVCDLAPDTRNGPDALTLRLVAHAEQPFPPTLRERTLELLSHQAAPLADLTELNFQIGDAFADAALQTLDTAGIGVEEIDLAASHGQTLYHLMEPGRTPSTWQAGESAVIAQRLAVTVTADFRVADIAAGGQGAPLVSYLDALLFAGPHTVALQNIGGIGNVTFVLGGSTPEDAYAFDTGPGNSLLDRAARVFGFPAGYDEGGQMALRGTVHDDLLAEMLAHPYYARHPPKSTGREVFGDGYADEILARAEQLLLSPDDTMATLAALTAASIVQAYRAFGPPRIEAVQVSGGGARNLALMDRLRAFLPESRVILYDESGMPGAIKEAAAFALLGYECIHGRPANLPSCTGAAASVVLGKITPGANYNSLLSRVAREVNPCSPTRKISLQAWKPKRPTPPPHTSTQWNRSI